MNFFWLLFGALILLVFGIGWSSYQTTECSAASSSEEQCSGALYDDHKYDVPAEGYLVHAINNNGPVEPGYQVGYELTISADGTVRSYETLPRDENGIGMQTDAMSDLNPAQIEEVIATLTSCGYFDLPQYDESDTNALPVGGPVSLLEVNLNGESWDVVGSALDPADAQIFAACQHGLADQLGLKPLS